MATTPLSDQQKIKFAKDLNNVQTPSRGLAIRGKMNSMGLNKTAIAAPLLLALAACSAANGASNNDTTSNSVAPVTANAVSSTPLSDPTAFKVGVVLATIQNWDGSRPFMNMLYGGGNWGMVDTNTWTSAGAVPAADLDANGWVKAVPSSSDRIQNQLSVPAVGGNFICRFQGNGQLGVQGGGVSNVVMSAGQTTFTVATTYPNPQPVTITYFVDPTNYIRNIDCREANASQTDTFAPEFMNSLQGFKVLRFVKWAYAGVEGNSGTNAAWGGGTQASPKYLVTWANRTKPGDANYVGSDGVPVEVMMQLASQANADPWFNMPWNADDDYITRFATYVRDNLAAGHQVYVEESNEVWNWGYPVATQAKAEAQAEGLPGADGSAVGSNLERYAEKTEHVMDIWKNVFAATGQSSQLVRVAAFQHVNPYVSDKLLGYMNLSQHVDALATAPYWGDGGGITGLTEDQIMTSYLPGQITSMVNFGAQQKAVAQKYGLRYVAYEAGQGLVIPANVALLQQVERDPRMYDLYKSFISQWQSQIGDTMNLFNLNSPINQYGGWGLWEYAGQPLSASPKMQAVREFLGLTTTTATADPTPTSGPTTTTITCPDGTVILSTSTCPTTSTTSTGSTSGSTSTSPGKRTGSTKGGGKSIKTATV